MQQRTFRLLVVSAALVFRIAIMTLRACGGVKRRRMAGAASTAAVIYSAAAFIGNTWMVPAVSCRPVFDSMAGGAVQPKQTRVISRIAMAVCTIGGQTRILSGGVTLLTRHPKMSTDQRELATVVIEDRVFPVGRVMTCRAICAVLTVMCIILLMT